MLVHDSISADFFTHLQSSGFQLSSHRSFTKLSADMMDLHRAFIVLSIMFTLSMALKGGKSLCTVQARPKFHFLANCPELCAPLTPRLFQNCVSRIHFGCRPVPCAGGFSCSYNDLPTATVAVPGDEIYLLRLPQLTRTTRLLIAPCRPPPVDVFILVSTKFTMSGILNRLRDRSNVDSMLSQFVAHGENLAVGLGQYRYEEDMPRRFRALLPVTRSRTPLFAALRRLQALGGGPRSDALLPALLGTAGEAPVWRKGSQRFVMVFTDMAGHEPACRPSKPGVKEGPRMTRATVAERLKISGVTLIVVGFSNLMNQEPFPYGCSGARRAGPWQIAHLTRETGGVHVHVHQAQLENMVKNVRIGVGAVLREKREGKQISTLGNRMIITGRCSPGMRVEAKSLNTGRALTSVIADGKAMCVAGGKGWCDISVGVQGGNSLGTVSLKVGGVAGCRSASNRF